MRQPTDALQIFCTVAVQVHLPLSFHSAAMLSQSEVEYIKGGCLEDCRVDGRSCREFRHHSLAVSSSSPASSSSSHSPLLIRSNGSARMLLDGTHVLCSIKADIVRPSETRPNQGALELSVEYHPHASGSPTGGGSRNSKSRNDEDVLQQLLEDLLLPHLLDLTSLCLVRGELAWRLSIDLLVLACGAGCSSASAGPGALLDAGAMTIIAALQNTWLPSVTVIAKEEEGEGEGETSSKGPKPSSFGLGRGRDANNDAATAELVVEGDMAKAQRVFELTNKEKGNGDGAGQQQQQQQQQHQQQHGAIHLVTVTILKCYATSPSTHEPPAARYVSLLDATCDEVACSHCQIHVAVRTGPAANDADPKRKESVVCALQTSGTGSVHLSLISDASQLAIAAAANRQRHVEVTDLSSLAGATSPGGGKRHPGNETMLLQELYALQ
jgi:exosome complex component RRP42